MSNLLASIAPGFRNNLSSEYLHAGLHIVLEVANAFPILAFEEGKENVMEMESNRGRKRK